MLDDTTLEKLHAYLSWLVRLLPNRELPPEIEITDDMLQLQKFKVAQKEHGDASLSPGEQAALTAINEFGAKPYTEDGAEGTLRDREGVQRAPRHRSPRPT